MAIQAITVTTTSAVVYVTRDFKTSATKLQGIQHCCSYNMTSLTNSVKYPAITIKNIYCDTIRISKCSTNDNYIATFTFNIDAGIHGLLLGEMKKQYRETSYVINSRAIAITCDPTIIDKNLCVIDAQPTDPSMLNTNRSRRYSSTTLSMVKVEDVAHRRPTLMSRTDVTFRDVFVYKDSSVGKDTWFVDYSSFDAKVLSPMRTREFVQ
jgi:hypothetical protein